MITLNERALKNLKMKMERVIVSETQLDSAATDARPPDAETGEADEVSDYSEEADGADAVDASDEVAELRKVIWPTRSMLITYTLVCMVFVAFMVIFVTSLDYGFTKLVFALFG